MHWETAGRKIDPVRGWLRFSSRRWLVSRPLEELLGGNFSLRAVRNPPALSGSQAVSAVDRVARRALDKNPSNRFASADEMAAELRWVTSLDDSSTHVETRAVKRLIVLPFRVLRPDPETDFLAFSLRCNRGIAGRIESLVCGRALRPLASGAVLDLREIAKKPTWIRCSPGLFFRAGTQLRLTTQLVEAPSGTLIWSKASQVELSDIFQLRTRW